MATGTGNLPNPSMSFSPFAILTAEEMNNILENINALADGTGIGDGSVGTSDLANLAVTTGKLANASVTSDKVDFTTLAVGFRAIPSGTLNFTGTESYVTYSTVQYNYGSGYDSSTGIFTAPVSGVYRFTAVARVEAVANTRAFVSLTFANSGIASQDLNFRGEDTTATARAYVAGSWEVYLQAGGTARLRGYAGSTVNVNAVAGQSWFAGSLVTRV